MYKFGNLEIKGKVVLAPMAGYTSYSYREFMNSFGVSFAVTEMVSDMGLIYDNKETNSYISFPKSNTYTGVQLFGSDPSNLAKALLICEDKNPNVDFYDVNMGCPVNKVIKTGAGSALLKDPKKCGEIIKALKKVTKKPISAKIRLGFDNNHINFVEVIKELIDAGVDLIAVHARTTKELYSGLPHYELLKDIKSMMGDIPLVVSGNIFTLDDAINALNITKADAVMIARGGVGNPTLISNINHYYNNEELESTDLVTQIKYCKELAKMMIEEKGENLAMKIYRSIAPKFFMSYPNNKKLKTRLSVELNTYKDLEDILTEYLEEFTL